MRKTKPNYFKSLIASMILLIPVVAFSESDSGYGAAKEDGFFYYKDPKVEKKAKPEKKPVQKKTEPAVPAPKKEEPKVKQVETPSPAPQPKFGSVAWLRENLDRLRDKAIDDPTFENIQAYKYAERITLDKSSNFAAMSQKVIDQDPMLNEAVRFPIAVAARSSALYQVAKARKAIMQDMTKKVGLWMFFDSSCTFCHAQYATMKLVQEKYPELVIQYISTDGKILSGMQNSFRMDVGGTQARKLGIQLTPAVVMVVPSQRKFAIIAHGAMAADELEHKMITAGIDMGITDNRLTNIAELEKRGIISATDMQKIQQEAEGLDMTDPQNIIKIINGAVKRNM